MTEQDYITASRSLIRIRSASRWLKGVNTKDLFAITALCINRQDYKDVMANLDMWEQRLTRFIAAR